MEARFTDRTGVRQVKYGRSRAQVTERLNAAMQRAGTGLAYLDGRITFGDYLVNVWLPAVRQRVKPRTYDIYEGCSRVNVIPRIGALPLVSLRTSDVETMIGDATASGLSPATADKMKTIVSMVLNHAMRDDLLTRNVASVARGPRIIHKAPAILSREQLSALMAAVRGDQWEAFYLLAITTGMRDAEIRALRWSDIDLDAGTVSITGQHQYRDGTLQRVAPKTDSSERTLPIGEGAAAVLRGHKVAQNKQRLMMGGLWAAGDYVFTREDGQPITPTKRQDHWTSLKRRVGLPATTRFHDLRHTAATHMLANGSSPKIIQHTLGHSAIRTTIGICTLRHFPKGCAPMQTQWPLWWRAEWSDESNNQ